MVYESMDAAVLARLELVDRIQSIDVQLSQRAAEVSNRVPDEEYKRYMEWKSRAVGAKKVLTSKLMRTKAWISQEREKQYKNTHCKEERTTI